MKITIGKNIELFRKKLNFKKKEMAEILDVNPSLITYYEQGKRIPSIGKLNKMAEIFEIPVEWLMSEDPGNVQFAARSKGRENSAETKEILFFQEIVVNFVKMLKQTGMPDYVYKGPQYSNKTPTGAIVAGLKKMLGIGNIVYYNHLKELLQSEFNIYLFEIPFRNEKISGVTFYKDQVFCVFINKGHTQQRRLFSIAHEFGHILFHIHRDSYLVSRLTSTDTVEKEANRFAEMFLISETHLNKIISKKRLHLFKKEYIQSLADFFQVSAESIFYSLAKKGLVKYNWKSYKPATEYRKDYDKSFTYNDLPWIYVLTSFLAFKQGHITISKFSELVFTDIRKGNEITNRLEEILEKESGNEAETSYGEK